MWDGKYNESFLILLFSYKNCSTKYLTSKIELTLFVSRPTTNTKNDSGQINKMNKRVACALDSNSTAVTFSFSEGQICVVLLSVFVCSQGNTNVIYLFITSYNNSHLNICTDKQVIHSK